MPTRLLLHTMHQRVMPGFIKLMYAKLRHLHHAPQTFVLREIENHVTGGRNDSTPTVSSTSHDRISYSSFGFVQSGLPALAKPKLQIFTARNSFYTLRNGCCQGVVDSCATTLHNFLRTVQATVDKRADECGQVYRHFSMSPTLHNALIITQFSTISTKCRHFCK